MKPHQTQIREINRLVQYGLNLHQYQPLRYVVIDQQCRVHLPVGGGGGFLDWPSFVENKMSAAEKPVPIQANQLYRYQKTARPNEKLVKILSTKHLHTECFYMCVKTLSGILDSLNFLDDETHF